MSKYARELVAVLWLIVLVVGGLAASVSMTGWMVLAAVGGVSMLILQRLWRPPAQSMSESIRNAQR